MVPPMPLINVSTVPSPPSARLESSNADLMLDSTFTDEEALKGYSVHPAHVEVAIPFLRHDHGDARRIRHLHDCRDAVLQNAIPPCHALGDQSAD